jgi:polar amino acid transport system permease protein
MAGVGVGAFLCPIGWARFIGVLSPSAALPLWSSLKVRRLQATGDIAGARVQSAKTLNLAWLIIGAAMILHVVGFMITLLLIKPPQSKRTTDAPKSVWDTFTDVKIRWDRETWSAIWDGFQLNVKLALVAQFFILIWSLLIAVLRMLPGKATAPVRWLVTAYGDLFRSLPGILVILMVNFGLRKANLPLLRELSTFGYSCLALTLIYGAYVSEVFRAGLDSVHPSQIAGARSLGLSYGQTLRFVSVPQAVRRVIPPLLNDFIALQKDTAILGFAGVLEGVGKARFVNNAKSTLAGYTIAAFMFFVITIPQTRITDYLLKRQQNKQFGRTKSKMKPQAMIALMNNSHGEIQGK